MGEKLSDEELAFKAKEKAFISEVIERIGQIVGVSAIAYLGGSMANHVGYKRGLEEGTHDYKNEIAAQEIKLTEAKIRDNLFGSDEISPTQERKIDLLSTNRESLTIVFNQLPQEHRIEGLKALAQSPMTAVLIAGKDQVAKELSEYPSEDRLEVFRNMAQGGNKVSLGSHTSKILEQRDSDERENSATKER